MHAGGCRDLPRKPWRLKALEYQSGPFRMAKQWTKTCKDGGLVGESSAQV